MEGRLAAVLANGGKLVLRRWLLAVTSFALDYAGSLLTYVCVSIPVFSGAAMALFILPAY
jgi:hypothetical protein